MKMLFMLIFTPWVDQYIIDEHCDKLVHILHENLVHQIHKVGRCISQSKWHHCILVQTIHQNKCSLRYVALSNLQLMISRSKINLREHTCTSELIKQIINPRKWILILDGNLIHGTKPSWNPSSYSVVGWNPAGIWVRPNRPLPSPPHFSIFHAAQTSQPSLASPWSRPSQASPSLTRKWPRSCPLPVVT
jgi:hypothetical protein